jgi:hypothetical protein
LTRTLHREHEFPRQKGRIGLFICKIGIARAEAKVTLAGLAHNLDRLILTRAALGDTVTPSSSPAIAGRAEEPPRRQQERDPGDYAEGLSQLFDLTRPGIDGQRAYQIDTGARSNVEVFSVLAAEGKRWGGRPPTASVCQGSGC